MIGACTLTKACYVQRLIRVNACKSAAELRKTAHVHRVLQRIKTNAAQVKPGFHVTADALAAAVQFPPGYGMLPVLHHALLQLRSASVQAASQGASQGSLQRPAESRSVGPALAVGRYAEDLGDNKLYHSSSIISSSSMN